MLSFPARSGRGVFFLLAGLMFAAIGRAATPPEVTGPRSGKWAHEVGKQTLTPDPHVMWGRLDNGFRFALLPSHATPGRVTLQLIVLSGSLDEHNDELGIAHYTEHMAFGGSKHFKPEDMVDLFQRLGVEYGSDVNAFTTFDRTAFRLDFRENNTALLREGLQLFRDFGDGVLFPPAIIERERKVVLNELRLHHTIADERQNAATPILFRGLQFPKRVPGGSEEQIAKFTREQFLKFYQRNYRSDLMVLVGAGDFEAADMAALVREAFGDMVRPHEPIPARDEGKLDAKTQRAGVFRIAGVNSAQVSVASVIQIPPRVDSKEARVEQQKRRFTMDLFATRLDGEMPGGGSEASYEDLMGNAVSTAVAGGSAQGWAAGIGALDQMVRLTMERGFDATDLETNRKRQLRMMAHELDQLPTIDAGMLCEDLMDSIVTNEVYVGMETELAWQREWLERFTTAEAQQIFRGLWPLNSMAYQVAGGVDIELGPDKVLQAVQKSRRSGLDSVAARQHRDTPFVMPKFGPPTEIVERRALPELGAQLLRFGNNAHLNFVQSHHEPGLVRAIVRVGSGLLTMPGNKPALKEFGLNTLLASGAVHFPPEQMSALTDERLLEFGFDIADRDAFTFRGVMATEQLEVFLGIVADILREPQFSNFAHEDERMRAAMERSASSVGLGDGMRGLTDYLFKGDPRFTWGQPLDYISMGAIDVKRWMEQPLSRGYLEVTIVGDLPEESVVKTFSRTLGALSTRAATKAPADQPKAVKVTAPPGFTRIEFVGEQNVGLVIGTWPVMGALHVRDQAALEVLGKILEIRVRTEVREKLGFAYAPSARFQSYDGFPGFALLQAQIDSSPHDTTKVAPVIESIGAQLAKEGVSEGEFIGARGILKSQLRQAFRDNAFLASVLMRAQERPEEIAEIAELHGGSMDKVTREDVNTWAAQVLPATNCRTAAIVPKAFVGVFESGK